MRKTRPHGIAGWIAAALGIMILLVFARVLSNGFVGFDDRLYVTQNPQVRSGLTLHGVAWAFTTQHTGNWHPVTWLSHMLDCQLYGLLPGPHHLTSVLLHAGNTVLLFLLLARATGAHAKSAVVAALFGIHPLHVESVAWVAERKDVLSAFFFFIAMHGYVAYVRRKKRASYLLSLLSFALALMAKPMVVTLPVVLLLMDFWPLRRLEIPAGVEGESVPLSKLVYEKIPFFALSAVSAFVTLVAQRSAGNVTALTALPLGERVGNAVVGYVSYLARTFWPSGLAFFYPYAEHLPIWKVVTSGAILLGATVASLVLLRRRPPVTIGWGWYLSMLVPVIGLIQVGAQATADRYTYLPLVGIFILLTWGVAEIARRLKAPKMFEASVVGVVLVCLVPVTWRQEGYWRDSMTLCSRALDVTTGNYVVEDLLGAALAREGRVQEAIPHLERSLEIQPRYATAHNNLANALALEGDFERAIAEYEAALRLKPELAEAHANLGIALQQIGRLEDAVSHLLEAVRIRPEFADAQRNLGVALGVLGRRDEAQEHYAEAARLNPRDAEAQYLLANSLLDGGHVEEAIAHYEEALRIDPGLSKARAKLAAIKAGGRSR